MKREAKKEGVVAGAERLASRRPRACPRSRGQLGHLPRRCRSGNYQESQERAVRQISTTRGAAIKIVRAVMITFSQRVVAGSKSRPRWPGGGWGFAAVRYMETWRGRDEIAQYRDEAWVESKPGGEGAEAHSPLMSRSLRNGAARWRSSQDGGEEQNVWLKATSPERGFRRLTSDRQRGAIPLPTANLARPLRGQRLPVFHRPLAARAERKLNMRPGCQSLVRAFQLLPHSRRPLADDPGMHTLLTEAAGYARKIEARRLCGRRAISTKVLRIRIQPADSR